MANHPFEPDLDVDYEPIPEASSEVITIGCTTCGFIACVCKIIEKHKPDCRYRKAATCVVGIECDHGRDVCQICDPCTCDGGDRG